MTRETEGIAPDWPLLPRERRGMIGVAKRVHVLTHHDPIAGAGVALCRAWAGLVQFVRDDAPITCRACLTKSLERPRTSAQAGRGNPIPISAAHGDEA